MRTKEDKIEHIKNKNIMKRLVNELNDARVAYYNGDPIFADEDYDRMFDSLKLLEEQTGYVMSNSPTITVGWEPMEDVKKIDHKYPLLSLEKTKQVDDLEKLFKGHSSGAIISFKLDGLTGKIIYDNGKLESLSTRGDGKVGEDITHLVPAISGIPVKVPFNYRAEIIGEIIIKYDDFNKLNEELKQKGEELYKNPRNLASGTCRLKDPKEAVGRGLSFYAFDMKGDHMLSYMTSIYDVLGKAFNIVPNQHVLSFDELYYSLTKAKTIIDEKIYPVDGAVVKINEIGYGESLGSTAHHPRNAMAFKWEDEIALTTLREITLQVGTTGQITPVANFDPVELEGSTVKRASLHNFDEIDRLKVNVDDTIAVYKANQIIPKVSHSIEKSGGYRMPNNCPECDSLLVKDGVNLYCKNDEGCKPQLIGKIIHFCSKNAMNIEGMGEETVKRFFEECIVEDIISIFNIFKGSYSHQEIMELDGFGRKSADKLAESIQKSKTQPLHRLLYGLSIPNVGTTASRQLAKKFGDLKSLYEASINDKIDSDDLDGYGEVLIQSLKDWFTKEDFFGDNIADFFIADFQELGVNMIEPIEENDSDIDLSGKTFVMTGDCIHFNDRTQVKETVISLGGRFTSAVSKKTTYLISNDTTTNTGKIKKARDLGISIITEEQFCDMIHKPINKKRSL